MRQSRIPEPTLRTLLGMLRDAGSVRFYVKPLSPNDNSKNQVYLGGSFSSLRPFTNLRITRDSDGGGRTRLKAALRFRWMSNDGRLSPAPTTQLILYPQYPEVRLSGFLRGSELAPSATMSSRMPGRVLVFGVTRDGEVIGYAAAPGSAVARAATAAAVVVEHGAIREITASGSGSDSRAVLIEALSRIHHRGWIESKRLTSDGAVVPCNSANCGGFTLEAELGIRPNAIAEPDYEGWEMKQLGAVTMSSTPSSSATLLTPNPTGGAYSLLGPERFIRTYGYRDLLGREDRLNFGGLHRFGRVHSRTHLRLALIGFDAMSHEWTAEDARMSLVDSQGREAASWCLADLLMHWNRKHARAAYVTSVMRLLPARQYAYGCIVRLGLGTDFGFFLAAVSNGYVYYDPGLKLENAHGSRPRVKERHQFRIRPAHLIALYSAFERVDVSDGSATSLSAEDPW